jgi:glutamine synthetase
MEVKRIHHECGAGQNEIELNLTKCMKNADDTVLCMFILRMLASQHHQKVLFSPKPFTDQAGNGLHHHILLRDKSTGQNVFLNPNVKDDDTENNENRLSDVCKHGIAGLLKYADEITAVFASSKESFVRLQPGFEAPSYTAWDFANRTALVRVPQTSKDATRFEYRGGDLSGSVHLFGSVLLAAILKGIEDELPLQPNSNFNVEKLSTEELEKLGIRSVPKTLEHCLEVLRTSGFLREVLGPEMVEVLIQRDEALLLG